VSREIENRVASVYMKERMNIRWLERVTWVVWWLGDVNEINLFTRCLSVAEIRYVDLLHEYSLGWVTPAGIVWRAQTGRGRSERVQRSRAAEDFVDAAAVCNTCVTGQFPARTQDGERRVSWTEEAKSLCCCYGAFLQPVLQGVWGRTTYAADWVHRRVDNVVCGKAAAVSATKLGQRNLITSWRRRDVIVCGPLVNTAATSVCSCCELAMPKLFSW